MSEKEGNTDAVARCLACGMDACGDHARGKDLPAIGIIDRGFGKEEPLVGGHSAVHCAICARRL